MCRLLAYLGPAAQPGRLIYDPEHSLEIQSYRPKETITTSVNADGVGMGWYDSRKKPEPFIYKNVLPIWADINLPHLGNYIDTDCFMAYVRSATPGQGSNLSNCQPFSQGRLLFTHNGFIDNFRNTLYLPIRRQLIAKVYRSIEGTTDSEHIFALILNEITVNNLSLEQAVGATLRTLTQLAAKGNVVFSANVVVSDGVQLVASRFAKGIAPPSLYWLSDSHAFSNSTIIASEALFSDDWQSFPENSILSFGQTKQPKMCSVTGD